MTTREATEFRNLGQEGAGKRVADARQGIRRGEAQVGQQQVLGVDQVELAELEVVASQHPWDGVRGRHQEPLALVDVVHPRGLRVDQVGLRLQSSLLRPFLA